MSWPAAVFWLILIWATASRGPALIYLVYVAGAFGSLQMLPGGGSGVNLLPQSVCAALLIAKVMNQRGNLARATEAMLDPSRLLLFTAFMAYGLVTAYALPRLFAGLIEVVPVSAFSAGTSILTLNSGNVTQSCYMLLSYGTVVAFAVMGSRPEVGRHLRLAVLWGSVALTVTGLADLVCYRTGLGALLDPFRTATYALLTDVEAVGAKRVVGLEPEASVYGSMCVNTAALLTFFRPFYPQGRQRLTATLMILCNVAMVVASTSSGAYLGLTVLGMLYAALICAKVASKSSHERQRSSFEIIFVAVAVLLFSLVLLARSDLLDLGTSMIDKMILQKSTSASYIERGQWNLVGFQAFLDSGGVGVGLGSLRTSNWSISILGSVGVAGSAAIFLFILKTFIPSSGSEPEAKFDNAIRLSLGPAILMYQLGGTIPDIGVPTAILLGMLSSRGANMEDRERSREPAIESSPSPVTRAGSPLGFGDVT